MTKSAPGEGSDYNAKIIKEFRVNQGRVGGPWAGTTLTLIHHIGARSGVERVTPLGCSPQPDGRLVIVASTRPGSEDAAATRQAALPPKLASCATSACAGRSILKRR